MPARRALPDDWLVESSRPLLDWRAAAIALSQARRGAAATSKFQTAIRESTLYPIPLLCSYLDICTPTL